MATAFSMPAAKFYIPTSNAQNSLYPCLCLSFSVFFLIANLMNVKWYLIVNICISLMVNDDEHLFIHLLAIYVSSLEKYLFKSFSIRLFFVVELEFFTYSGHQSLIQQIIFSHSMSCYLTVLMVSLDAQVPNFMKQNLPIFSSVAYAFRVISRKSLPNTIP